MQIKRRVVLQMAASALLTAQLAGCASTRPRTSAAMGNDASLPESLARLAQDLFPHPGVNEQKYRDIARHFLQQDPELSRRIVTTLETEKPYARLSAPVRRERIAATILTPELQAYRFAVIVGLYDDLSVTRLFGYEGPSFEQFGYIDRGFNDLNWLPEPPVATARDRGL